MVELFKFFKRNDFPGNEEDFQNLISQRRIRFDLLEHEPSNSSSRDRTNSEFTTDSTAADDDARINNCEQCQSEIDLKNSIEKDENFNNKSFTIGRNRKSKKKITKGFWRYIRCTLAPKH